MKDIGDAVGSAVEVERDLLGVGMAGIGLISDYHAKGWLERDESTRIVAVADIDPARATAFVERHGLTNVSVHADFAALIADPAVDVIDICTPPHLHAPAVIAAARAGKAILCEKPLCNTHEEAQAIADALSANPVPFQLAHNQLFQPSLAQARKLLDFGEWGRVLRNHHDRGVRASAASGAFGRRDRARLATSLRLSRSRAGIGCC